MKFTKYLVSIALLGSLTSCYDLLKEDPCYQVPTDKPSVLLSFSYCHSCFDIYFIIKQEWQYYYLFHTDGLSVGTW